MSDPTSPLQTTRLYVLFAGATIKNDPTCEVIMITIYHVDTSNKADVRRFIDFPFSLYRDHELWVPPIRMDVATRMNPEKHPFYEHSRAEFYLAVSDGKDVGRIAVMENRPYNRYHDKRQAQFYYLEFQDDLEVARALFQHAFEWAQKRGLNQMVGPKGFGPLDGYGMLLEGFEHRPAMTMMNYNPPYYPQFMGELGFRKEVDFVSCYLSAEKFRLPERVHRIAERAAKRSGLAVKRFNSKRELLSWASKIGRTYNDTFIHNWEYYPLTDREIKYVTDEILTIADPRLIKIIIHGDDVVGFLFGFADVSAAIQRCKGRLFPFGILDILIEMKRTKWIALNGAGVLPDFQGRGGNALLYSEMEKTVHEFGFQHADLTQVAESAVQMRRDLENVGGMAYKNHRVYIRDL
jgi:GNAT superfamily N-acetyltransferase